MFYMTTATRIATAIAAIILAALGTIATAGDAHATITIIPGAALPVTHDGPVVIQLNAPAGSWQIKRTSRAIDAQLANVTVRTSGDCDTADVCVNVVVGSWDTDQMLALSYGTNGLWSGLTSYDEPDVRTVYLNVAKTFRRTRPQTAAHEFGHVLGLDHHGGYGVTSHSLRATLTLTLAEVAVIEGSIAAQRGAVA